MSAYAGSSGSATFLRPPRAGELASRPYTAGITAWHVRVSVESTGLLLCRTAAGVGGLTEVPLLKEVFVGAHAADLQLTGHLDSEDNPFDDLARLLVPQAAVNPLIGNRGVFLLELDEAAQIDALQAGFVNFYAEDCVTPYVALAARGPWVVTLKGAVLYDAGGYGMLGFGHTPAAVLEALARPQVMANVMTPNLAQRRFTAQRPAPSPDAPGGVRALTAATDAAVEEIAQWLKQAQPATR